MFVTNSQTSALIVKTGQQSVCNLVLFQVVVWRCNMYGFLPVETMASTLPFSMIAVAGHVHSLGFPGNTRPNVALFTLVLTDLEVMLPL